MVATIGLSSSGTGKECGGGACDDRRSGSILAQRRIRPLRRTRLNLLGESMRGMTRARSPRHDRGGIVMGAMRNQAAIYADFHFRTSWSRPFMVFIEPTLRCPMGCRFCDLPYDSTFPRARELPIERWMGILRELKDFSPLVRSVYISGGEPFLRRDLIDLIEYAHNIGLGTRTLTIGWFLDPRLCDRLIRSPMDFLKFSIHSSRQAVHDSLVRRPVFERATRAISYLRSNGYPRRIGMLCTVFQGNVDHLDEIVQWAAEFGIEYILLRPLFGQTVAQRIEGNLPTDPRDFNAECVVADIELMRTSIEKVKVLKRQGLPVANSEKQLDLIVAQAEGTYHGFTGCHMMYESIYIKPDGTVQVCGHLALGEMGSVASRSVSDVLTSPEAYAARHLVTRDCQCPANGFIRKSFGEKAALVTQLARGGVQ